MSFGGPLLGSGGYFVLFSEAVGEEANEESGNGKNGGSDDEKIRGANVTHVMLGDISAEDRPKSTADGDETIKAFALLHREQVGHERPEDGGVKQIENTDPNKKPPINPYLLRRGTDSHREKKEGKHENEESVDKWNEFSPRHPRYGRREGCIRDQHRD